MNYDDRLKWLEKQNKQSLKDHNKAYILLITKSVDIWKLKHCRTVAIYNSEIWFQHLCINDYRSRELTEEEFIFLNEVIK